MDFRVDAVSTLFYPLKPSDLPFFKRKLTLSLGNDARGIVAFRDGKLSAAVAAHEWTPNSCFMHWIIEDPMVLRHKLFEQIADWIFNETHRTIIYGKIVHTNSKSIKLAEHIGFKQIARLKDGFKEGVDFLIFEMRKDTCRWLNHD